MLSVDEALQRILAAVEPLAPVPTPLAESLGLTLAEEIISDVDSPPFDKSLMDGYALREIDLTSGPTTLAVIEEVTAGKVPSKPVGAGEATRIMTGALLPDGADVVVPVERTRFDPATKQVEIQPVSLKPGANIMFRGTSMQKGEIVLPAHHELRPQELGALAELGVHTLSAYPRPRVAVLATGDELVPVDQTPGPGQIRNSNETMLVAQIRRAGAEAVPLGIARDNREHLAERIAAGLECDMLILSGGVSAGKLDLVPSELEASGVRQVFHKVHVKPGKPVWYGNLGGVPGVRCHVFGLPGNPVSSLVCFELFARTAIRRLMGWMHSSPAAIPARLVTAHIARDDRPTYHPARVLLTEDGPIAKPVPWHGSADLRSTVEANAMILFPPGERDYQPGDIVDVYCWDRL